MTFLNQLDEMALKRLANSLDTNLNAVIVEMRKRNIVWVPGTVLNITDVVEHVEKNYKHLMDTPPQPRP